MLSVIQMTHIAVTLCMVLVSTTSAYAWYPYGDRYMQWQKSRPLMYGALHNSMPEDQMPSRVARFKAAGLNTVAWWKPGNAIQSLVFDKPRNILQQAGLVHLVR